MKIAGVKSRRTKAEIFFDNGDKIIVSKPVWEKSNFSPGSEISDSEIQNLVEQDEIFLIKASSLRIIARREHSRKELETKLIQKGFSKKNINYVLDILERDNFLNDERFAELYVRQSFEFKRKSPRVVRYELSRKGIKEPVIEKYLNGIAEDEIFENALALAMKKLRANARKDREKQLLAVRNHLLYKAYSHEIVNRVLTELKERLEV